jgi:anti-sigma factor (TIGR02949 family)
VIACRDAVRQLWEYLDRAVGEADRAAIEEHLRFCRRCCGELEFAQELQRFLASHAPAEIPPDVHQRLLSALDDLETAP